MKKTKRNLKNVLMIIIILAISSISILTLSIPQKNENRLFIEKGQEAPFSGHLLSNEDAAKLISGFELKINKLKLKVTYLEKQLKVRINQCNEVNRLKLETEKAKLKLCEKTRKIENNIYQSVTEKQCSGLFKNPYFNFILGNVSGSLLGLGFCQLR